MRAACRRRLGSLGPRNHEGGGCDLSGAPNGGRCGESAKWRLESLEFCELVSSIRHRADATAIGGRDSLRRLDRAILRFVKRVSASIAVLMAVAACSQADRLPPVEEGTPTPQAILGGGVGGDPLAGTVHIFALEDDGPSLVPLS